MCWGGPGIQTGITDPAPGGPAWHTGEEAISLEEVEGKKAANLGFLGPVRKRALAPVALEGIGSCHGRLQLSREDLPTMSSRSPPALSPGGPESEPRRWGWKPEGRD